MENRDSTIDIAKGICIFLMVLGHTFFYSWFNDRVYLFHMPFFFFVSGFFFSTKNNLKDFVLNKTKRLLVPMLIYWAFGMLLTLPMALQSGNLPEFHIGALWFLLSLWTIFILAYFISKFAEGYISKLLLGFVFLAVAYGLKANDIQMPCHFVQSLFMLPIFLLGMIFYQSKIHLIKDESYEANRSLYQLFFYKMKYYLLIGFLGLVILAIGNLGYLNIERLIVPNPFSLFVGAFSGIFLILVISKICCILFPKITKFLSNLGKKSLHVLGFHFAILEILYFFVIALGIRMEKWLGVDVHTGLEIKQMPLLALLLAIVATCISYYLGHFFEKTCPSLWSNKKT